MDSDTPRTDALEDEIRKLPHNFGDYLEARTLARQLERELAASQRENEELKRIRELCLKALVRATGKPRDLIEEGPFTCAVAHAKRVEELERALRDILVESIAGWLPDFPITKIANAALSRKADK